MFRGLFRQVLQQEAEGRKQRARDLERKLTQQDQEHEDEVSGYSSLGLGLRSSKTVQV